MCGQVRTSQDSGHSMICLMGSLKMQRKYSEDVSFINWSINIVERVLARNRVATDSGGGREGCRDKERNKEREIEKGR